MAVEETTRVLTVYRADVSQEKAALDDLIKKINQLKSTETAAAQSREHHFDQLVLDLTRANKGVDDAAMSWDGWGKKASGFSSAWGKVSSGIAGVGKAMTPLNQGLELAGKVVRFAEAGLDAYAKTSAEAASEVNKLKKEFEGYSQAVMSTVGHVTTEILKQAMSFDEVRKQLIRLENTDAYKRLYGGADKGFFGDNEGDSALANLTSGLGKLKAAAQDTFKLDAWNTGAIDDALGRVKDRLDETREATKRAATEAARYRAELAALAGKNAKEVTDELVKQLESETAFSAVNSGLAGYDMPVPAGPSSEDLAKAYENLRSSAAAEDYESFRAGKQKAFLEETFGSVDEFSVYAEAFNMLGGAVSTAMNAWIDGSMSAGEAVRKFLADSLKGLASSMAVEALKHSAYAIGSLAFGDVRGAGTHAAAAAAFGAGAAAAAVAAKAMGGGGTNVPQANGASAGGSSAGGSSAGGGSRDHRTASQGGSGQNTYVIVYGEHFYSESNRMRQLDAQRFVKAAVGNSFAEQS